MFRLSLVFVSLFVAIFGSAIPKVSLDFSKEGENRIVGGTDAHEGEFPYQASLRSSLNSHFCGASIISATWLLSAAHCTEGRTTANTIAVVGTTHRVTGGTTYTTSQIVNHPNYNANTIANDVSVVQTSQPMVFGALVQPITLGSAFVGGGATAVVSGWGQTTHPGSAPEILQRLTVSTLTNEDCRDQHNAVVALMVFDHKICTFSREGEGICFGDSGGPLTVGNTVAGIVSWVIPCGVGRPDVYDRVSSHRTWILEQM